MTDELHIGDRIADLAAAHPEQVAIIVVGPRGEETAMTWSELDQRANAAARGLKQEGVRDDTVVGVALPPGFEHAVAVVGSWKLGATVVPLNPRAGERERRALKAALGGPIIGTGTWADHTPAVLERQADPSPVPGRGRPRSATVSGGSTGMPRLVVRDRPWVFPGGEVLLLQDRLAGALPDQRQLVVLPLYHAGFSSMYKGLALDNVMVVLSHFRAELFFEAIQRHHIEYLRIVPSYMRMALDAPDAESYDLSSVVSIHHGSAPCPGWVKRRWIELFGAEKIVEHYASTERIGVVSIRGDEWLRHPGSVGRAELCDVRILDDSGKDLPAGEVGMIYLRDWAPRQPEYLGPGAPLPEQDGFRSVGDLGYLDEDGYLFLVDRKVNVINSGGIDVYPSEIEATLLGHPEVVDAAVVGRPHKYLGNHLHGIVVPRDPDDPPSADELERFCRQALTTAKVPLSFEMRASLGRTEAGKLRRSEL